MILNVRTKSFLLILLTLMIGFTAGFLTSGRLASQRFQKIKHRWQEKERFVDHLLTEVLKASPEKQEVLRPILEQHFVTMDSINRSFRGAMRQGAFEMREAMRPHLSPAQIKKLEDNMRMRKRKRHQPRNGPPPGGRRPPGPRP